MNELDRKLLIEQTRRELIGEILQYQVGQAVNGEVVAVKNTTLNGRLCLVPEDQWLEWEREV